MIGQRAPGTIVVGDVVRTPSGREARVMAAIAGRLSCIYLDDGDEVVLVPTLLKFLRKAYPSERE